MAGLSRLPRAMTLQSVAANTGEPAARRRRKRKTHRCAAACMLLASFLQLKQLLGRKKNPKPETLRFGVYIGT
jgi:hypothetical protein